jgi:hypothetical protein
VVDGTVRPDVDPQTVSVAVLGQLRGISMQHQLAPETMDTERVAALVADTWRRALQAG